MAENQTLPQLATVSTMAASDLLYLVRTSTLDRAIAWSDVVTSVASGLAITFQPLDSALTSIASLVSNVYAGSSAWSPGSISANGGTATTTVGITGVIASDIAITAPPADFESGLVLQALAGTGSVTLVVTNTTGSPISRGSFDVKILVFRLA